MKVSGKMCFKIILKATKNQTFTLSLEDTIFVKPQGVGFNLTPPLSPPFLLVVLGLRVSVNLSFRNRH